MQFTRIIEGLSNNRMVYKGLLEGLPTEEYLWKPKPDKWCMLEIICHLYDEEREDFRARVKHVLETPGKVLPQFDPLKCVQEKKYIEQDFGITLGKFLQERQRSLEWLDSLKSPNWNNAFVHAEYGPMTAKMFLINWLAHDYLHIRQITNLKLDFLQELTQENFHYARGL